MTIQIQSEQLIIAPKNVGDPGQAIELGAKNEPIYVREHSGKYQKRRNVGNWILMLLFLAIPWIPYQGHQAVLLDVGQQKFHFFHITLWPQDFMVLMWLFVLGAFALFFVSTWLGRVWCGFTCPQTVWTNMFFWVEAKIEGKRNARIKLDKEPMSLRKAGLKTAKHFVWLILSLLTATSFMAYFVPAKELYAGLVTFNLSAIITGWVLFFAFCTYGNAGWMREKMCLHVCPYARFQSAMFDKNTITVTYDDARGENRGPRKRKADLTGTGMGDCVDCNLCVQVCPTGIDIRNGLQYECINCGACADICDETMGKFGYKKGLISFTSESELAGKKPRFLRPNLVGYAMACAVISMLMVHQFTLIEPIDLSVIRDRNSLYREDGLRGFENAYQLKIINKTQQDRRYLIQVDPKSGTHYIGPEQVNISAGEMLELPVTLSMRYEDVVSDKTQVEFSVTDVSQPEVKIVKQSNFFSG